MKCKLHYEENCSYCESQDSSFLEVSDYDLKLSANDIENGRYSTAQVAALYREVQITNETNGLLHEQLGEYEITLDQHKQRIQELIEKFERQYEISRVLEDALRETTELLDGVYEDFIELDIRKRKNKRLVEDIHKSRYENAIKNLTKEVMDE